MTAWAPSLACHCSFPRPWVFWGGTDGHTRDTADALKVPGAWHSFLQMGGKVLPGWEVEALLCHSFVSLNP